MISSTILEEDYAPIPSLTLEERESIIKALKDEGIWFAPHEIPTVQTIKSMFQSLSEGASFHFVGQTIIHTLTRLTTEELLAESHKFYEAPEYYPNISLYDYAYVAGIIHYHFNKHGLPIPEWVYSYQTNSPVPLYTYQHITLTSESAYQYPHPILQLYGIDLPLYEIGERDERFAYDIYG